MIDWLKKWWWTIILIMGMFFGLLIGLMFRKGDEELVLPNFVKKAEDRKHELESKALIQKIEAKAKSDKERAILDQTKVIKDPRERRNRLADLLETL